MHTHHTYTHTHTYIHTCIHAYMHTGTFTCSNPYMYRHVHTYIHTHTHSYIRHTHGVSGATNRHSKRHVGFIHLMNEVGNDQQCPVGWLRLVGSCGNYRSLLQKSHTTVTTSAKEICNFEEPTNYSHPLIVSLLSAHVPSVCRARVQQRSEEFRESSNRCHGVHSDTYPTSSIVHRIHMLAVWRYCHAAGGGVSD